MTDRRSAHARDTDGTVDKTLVRSGRVTLRFTVKYGLTSSDFAQLLGVTHVRTTHPGPHRLLDQPDLLGGRPTATPPD